MRLSIIGAGAAGGFTGAAAVQARVRAGSAGITSGTPG